MLHWKFQMGWNTTRKALLSSLRHHLLRFICLSLMFLFYGCWTRLQLANPDSGHSNSGRDIVILLWYWPLKMSLSLKGDVCWDLYRIPHCTLVDQHLFYPAADVVVFHNKELTQGQKLPFHLPQPSGQRWAWMSLEAPVHNGKLQKYANIFNLTITYRRDADVTIPYGELLPKEAGEMADEAPTNKTNLICWVVSNYNSHHRRSQVFKKLKAVVPVKVYGRWANRVLTAEALLPTISRCYFYLSFENSISKDYITEKLWQNAYQARAVPVVLGPPIGDYKAVAPLNSFIHVDNFSSIEALGKHLQQLAGDKKRYSEYFRWRHKWKVKLYTDWRERLCKICTVYNSLPQHKVYTDLHAWLNAANT
ncbi:alpha-(1,3)-fucosyltransferase 7 [Thalassophryne amazonica]|uniref:alpha-(1,3)-fucosyltransferase 7 n=1 Tax=Thalassophryne amazonica TaxID=390379 RepID=UPI0014714EF3|nr:alpha-(1,3)-fucosyltransferase 7 [Thalassophryne amazonica]